MKDDLISRQAAIAFICSMEMCDEISAEAYKKLTNYLDELPSASPERLTDDDFETIRIHLNAHKEKLCNQNRWEEAEEYQRIIDRFMAFASAQPDIIRCKDCKHSDTFPENADNDMPLKCLGIRYGGVFPDWYCEHAERRQNDDGVEKNRDQCTHEPPAPGA